VIGVLLAVVSVWFIKSDDTTRRDDMNILGLIFNKFDAVISDAIAMAILRSFPAGFCKELIRSTGTRTITKSCGCFLKAEHDPERHRWILTVDYSKCRGADFGAQSSV